MTLVPDKPEVLTSSAGWDVIANKDFLRDVTARLHNTGVRVSIFIEADPEQVRAANEIGADRVELYTKPYADLYPTDPAGAVEPYVKASAEARHLGMGLNAGHDLNLQNLRYFKESLPLLDEVSIGHALVSDALYLGIAETIRQYLKQLQ